MIEYPIEYPDAPFMGLGCLIALLAWVPVCVVGLVIRALLGLS